MVPDEGRSMCTSLFSAAVARFRRPRLSASASTRRLLKQNTTVGRSSLHTWPCLQSELQQVCM